MVDEDDMSGLDSMLARPAFCRSAMVIITKSVRHCLYTYVYIYTYMDRSTCRSHIQDGARVINVHARSTMYDCQASVKLKVGNGIYDMSIICDPYIIGIIIPANTYT